MRDVIVDEVRKEVIFENIRGFLNQLAADWEYSGEVTPKTFLIADLGLESIDIVILATSVTKYYQQSIPFSKFFAEMGKRGMRDIRLDEFVEFIYRHLSNA
jgi:acyl carrier protein